MPFLAVLVAVILCVAAVGLAEAMFVSLYRRQPLRTGAWWQAALYGMAVPLGNALLAGRAGSSGSIVESPGVMVLVALFGLGASWILLRYGIEQIRRAHGA